MRKLDLGMLAACAALIAVPLVISTVSAAPAPPPAAPAGPPPPEPVMPPSLPATHVVDLMTAQGAAAFGAQWRTMEAKIVDANPMEGQRPDSRRPNATVRNGGP